MADGGELVCQTPPRELPFEGPTEFDNDISQGQYIRACAYLATQATQEGTREEYMVAILNTFFKTWRIPHRPNEPILAVQDWFITKAKAVKALLQWESLDRTFVVPNTHWRVWTSWHPSRVITLSSLIRWEHAARMCVKFPPAYVSWLLFPEK